MSTQFRAGHKQTEVGVIPDDWEVKPLHDLADKIMVGIASAATHAYRDRGVVMFRNQNIKPGYLDDSDLLYIAEDYEATFRNKRLKAGDLLTARTGYPGTTSIVPSQYEGAQSFTTLITRPRRGVIDPEYLCVFINSESGQAYFEQNQIGGGQKNVNAGSLKQLPVAFPPTNIEQRAIAEALSDADALIESLEQLLVKKRHLKQGTMQELLTPKHGWSVEKLENVADVIDPHPTHRAPPEVSNGVPFIGIGDINEDGDILSTRLRTVGAPVFDEHRARYKIEDGLIGLGRVASIGKVVRLKDVGVPFAISPTLGVIRGTKVSQNYLFQALKSRFIVEQFARIMSGSTRSSVGMVVLRQLDIPVPKLESEQSAISTTLADMDAEITQLESQLAKTHVLKQGMMHKLLTGEIRLL